MGHSCISKGLMEKWSEGMGAGGLGRLFMGHPDVSQIVTAFSYNWSSQSSYIPYCLVCNENEK